MNPEGFNVRAGKRVEAKYGKAKFSAQADGTKSLKSQNEHNGRS